jgi:hypothetical protein
MPEINQLTAVDSLAAGDSFPIFDTSNGDARKVSASALLAYMQANLTFPDVTGVPQFDTQYAAPSSSGFSVTITPVTAGNNVHLILTPTAGYAAGTIILPAVAGVVDKQEVLVNCTQQVTALTINGNGAVAVTGEPTSLGADDFFRLKYDAVLQTWYRVG